MSIRVDIVKALAKSEKRANVVPFPKGVAKPKVKRVKKPKVYKRIIEDGDGGFVAPGGKNDRFKRETIGGKPHMRREDGALFKLRNDGTWVRINEPRSGGRRKKGSLLPYAAAAGLGAATAGGIYASQDDD